jgi:uncharacterized membrane protein
MAKAEGRAPRRARQGRLDQPIAPRRVLTRPTYDAEAFGRTSERIARFLGTGRFLVYQSAFIAFWIVVNVALPSGDRFDKYPFQFLTLILSLQAAYAAPLILLAQNRQDDRDRVNLEQDRQQVSQQGADTEFVARELAAVRIALGDVVTRDFLRSELRALLEEGDLDRDHARKDKKKKSKRAEVLVPGPDRSAEEDPNALTSSAPELSSDPETPMPPE